MPTVGKEIALSEVERLKKLKRPPMYCIARYRNIWTGNEAYKLCYRQDQFAEMRTSPFVGKIDIIWASPRCVDDLTNC